MRFATVVSFFLLCSLLHAATLNVPADFTTIQAAIDAAASGDTVLVAAGTYPENIDFKGKKIVVKSSDGPQVTTLDGGQSAAVVRFSGGEVAGTVLEGFLITNGRSETGGGIGCYCAAPTIRYNRLELNSADKYGGGIYCKQSGAWIHDNLFKNNTAVWGGGGLCAKDSTPTIQCNQIIDNTATAGGLEGGAGIYCDGGSPKILDNTLCNNSSAAMGGGIFFWFYHAKAVIEGNCIEHNTAEEGGGISYSAAGTCLIAHNVIKDNTNGGLYVTEGEQLCAEVEGNVVAGNEAVDGAGGIYFVAEGSVSENVICNNKGTKGGGMYLWSWNGDVRASNNLIFNNEAGKGGGIFADGVCLLDPERKLHLTNNTICDNWANQGGGLYFWNNFDKADLLVRNSILWNNDALQGPEIFLFGQFEFSAIKIEYTDLERGQASLYNGGNWRVTWGDGMINADPSFVEEATGDYHLQYFSPCRDAGDSAGVAEPNDFEGDPRIAQDSVDLGADEFYRHFYITGDKTPGGGIQGKWIGLPGSAPLALFIGSGVLDPPMPTPWGNYYLQAPWAVFPIPAQIPAGGVFAWNETLPLSPQAPYDLPMQALIGTGPDALSNLEILEVR